MTQYIQTVRSRALAGREAEYHDWYVTTHIPQLLSTDEFVSAEFYRMVSEPTAPAEFLCIYTVETSDIAGLQEQLVANASSMTPSEAMDVPATRIEVFTKASS